LHITTCGYSLLLACLLLSGCAPLPEPGAQPEIKTADHYVSPHRLSSQITQPGEWPRDPWWQDYADPQLNQLMSEALLDAPDLATAQARLQQAKASARQAGAPLLPELSAQGSVGVQKVSYNNGTPAEFTPQNWNDVGRVGLDFSYELDFWGKNRAQLNAALSEEHAASADAAQARLLLTTNLAASYAELARLYANLDSAKAAVEIRRQTATLFAKRQANGLETLGSLRQVESRLASAEGEQIAIEESIALQEHQLAALMGAGPDRGAKIQRPNIQLSTQPSLPQQLAFDLLGRRPDVVAARWRVEAASGRIDVAKAQFYPNVNLSAFLGFQSLGLDNLTRSGSDIGNVGPAISLPLFNGGRLKGQYQGTEASYAQAVASYDATVTEAYHQTADTLVSLGALQQRLLKSRQAVQAASDAHQIARNRYQGGLATYLDVLSAEDGLLSSQRELANLQTRLFSLHVALVRALGGGYQTQA
jgi:NodT family efflux transporter outer membrane factor (OMF) lipoprotein